MDILEIKNKVIQAGKDLLEAGLIVRTWGNISARIDDETFVITPSGKAYDGLTPDDIVTVKIADCTYEGDVKPSSEKGIHAKCYELRPNCNFVIHTHQMNASIISALGRDINYITGESAEIIGDNIPVASYGLSGTGKLKNAVVKALNRSASNAVIMKHHGALCLGADYDEAFRIAVELEKVCQEYVFKQYKDLTSKTAESFADVYKYVVDLKKRGAFAPELTAYDSERDGKYINLTDKDGGQVARINMKSEELREGDKYPSEADMHIEVYKKRSDVNYIIHSKDGATVAASSIVKRKMRPLIDDFAQIAGVTIKNASFDPNDTLKTKKNVAKALGKHKTVALVRDNGAVCVGPTLDEAQAAEIVAEKNCKTFVSSKMFAHVSKVGKLDSLLENVVYRLKYSKQK